MLSCLICGKVFLNLYNLERYMNIVYMNVKLFCCEICGKLFVEKRIMIFYMYL